MERDSASEDTISKCATGEGFGNPGGFQWSLADLESVAQKSKQDSKYADDTVGLLVLAADTNCSGTVSRDELGQLKKDSTNSDVRDAITHIEDNFSKYSNLAKNDWSEVKDQDARSLVEKYLKDNAGDDVISKDDLKILKTVSPFGMSFFNVFDLEPELNRAVKDDGFSGLVWGSIFGGGKVQAYNELARRVNERIATRNELLKRGPGTP